MCAKGHFVRSFFHSERGLAGGRTGGGGRAGRRARQGEGAGGGGCAVVTWPQPPPAWGCSSGLEAPRRGAGAQVCQRGVSSQPAAARPPCQGERQGAGSPGALLGRSWGGARGWSRRSRRPRRRRSVKEPKGAGSAVTPARGGPSGALGREGEQRLEGPLSCLERGRRGSKWGMVDSKTASSLRAGNEVSAVQVQILELCGAAGVVRGCFRLQDGRREGGHRGLLVRGAPREVAPGPSEIVLEPGGNLGWVTGWRHSWCRKL